MLPHEFVLLYKPKLLKLLVEDYAPTESVEGALTTILSLQPDELLPSVINFATTKLTECAGVHITRDDYFTYLLPEGELYDKSVISG